MRFGTWNVRSLYRSGSLSTVATELARYKLDLVVMYSAFVKYLRKNGTTMKQCISCL